MQTMEAPARGPVATDPWWIEFETLLACGYRVVPLRGREPMWKNWAFGRLKPDGRYGGSSATADLERLAKVFGGPEGPPGDHLQRPQVAVPLGQPFGSMYSLVVDVDAERGGLDSYRSLVAELGAPPVTAMVSTKSEDCFHLHLLSSGQWLGLPKEVLPGVEIKRAGQLAVTPPSPGYRFVQHPAEVGAARWAALDQRLFDLLYNQPAPDPVLEVASEPASGGLAWAAVDDCLYAIMAAVPGRRTDALGRFGGRACYLQAVGAGLASTDELRAALLVACSSNRLIGDYGVWEIARKVDWLIEHYADPAVNPYLNDFPTLRGGGGQHKELGRFSNSQRRVLLDVVKRCGWSTRHMPTAYSKRYGAVRTGLSDWSVRAALVALVEAGLLEEGTRIKNDERRATRTYRPTVAGVLLARQIEKDEEDK